jgi:uracil-DNA glycosylase
MAVAELLPPNRRLTTIAALAREAKNCERCPLYQFATLEAAFVRPL